MYLTKIANQIRAHVSASDLPDEDTAALFHVYAVLALAVGEQVTREDVHNAWVAWMLGRDPDHDALVPFDALDDTTAAMDLPYVEAIRQVARSLSGSGQIEDR